MNIKVTRHKLLGAALRLSVVVLISVCVGGTVGALFKYVSSAEMSPEFEMQSGDPRNTK